jgi:pimeloyl-ACP methyl ester carboxylesterase
MPCRRWLLCWVAAWTAAISCSEALSAEPEKELPDPIPVDDLRTGDGVRLEATFFPGTEGKATIPIILLHSWKGDRREYAGFARFLQREGHAVLVPDLRGHGDSTQIEGTTRELDGSKISSADVKDMVYKDMPTLKAFLVKQNDAGELNLSKLCIVGADMGAVVALYYAEWDWMLPAENKVPSKDVKALVLLSPRWSFKGLPLNQLITRSIPVGRLISMLVVVGKEDQSSYSEAVRLQKLVERLRPDPPPDAPPEQRNFYFIERNTRLQGTKMLGVRGLGLETIIPRFLELQLSDREGAAYAWRARRDAGPGS